MSRFTLQFRQAGFTAILLSIIFLAPAQAQNWPELYDPMALRTLNLTLSAQDWNTVRNDESFSYEAPAQLWMPNEPSILVGVRRKSGVTIPGGGSGKISLKIDINQFVEHSWHGVKKVSLEHGADTSTLLEGFAWYTHRQAWIPGGYPYMPPLATWAKVYVNGEYFGVYVMVEQVDKRFLELRGLWLSDDTWLYKQSDVGPPVIEFGPLTHSPTYTELCYSPFPPQTCPTPSPSTVATHLAGLIDMQGMLTLGAVNAWCYSPDNLLAKGKNHYYSDSRYRKRFYYPWDLDASFGGLNPDQSIYQLGNSDYVNVILNNSVFRDQYNTIMQALLDGPFVTSTLIAAINNLESVLGPTMSTDPYNPVLAEDFDALRNYVTDRNVSVAAQLSGGAIGVEPTPASPPAPLFAHPNPTNVGRKTRIEFHMERSGPVRVAVYDVTGARVRALVDDRREAGTHHVDWEGTDDLGRPTKAGVYFIGFRVENKTWNHRIVRVR